MIQVQFPSADSLLQGYYFPSATATAIPTVVFLQGFPGTEGDDLICEPLANAGVNVLSFNYRGVFASEGYFSFSHAVEDADAARRFLKDSRISGAHPIDPQNIVLGGWSFGGSMAPLAAHLTPEFERFFVITGRNFTEEARRIDQDKTYAAQVAQNLAGIRTPDGPVNYHDDLLTELVERQDEFDNLRLAPLLTDRKILLIGGWEDELVSLEDHLIPFYRALVRHGAENVRIETIQDDHAFTKHQAQLVRIIVEWLSE